MSRPEPRPIFTADQLAHRAHVSATEVAWDLKRLRVVDETRALDEMWAAS